MKYFKNSIDDRAESNKFKTDELNEDPCQTLSAPNHFISGRGGGGTHEAVQEDPNTNIYSNYQMTITKTLN